MKPVDQTVFGAPHGNCLMACVASILEVPLDSLPVLHDEIEKRGGAEELWWVVLQDTLRSHGFTAIYYPNHAADHPDVAAATYPEIAPVGYHIGSGTTNRGLRHATVYLDGRLAHDPHPSRDGLLAVERYYLITPLAPPSPNSAVETP